MFTVKLYVKMQEQIRSFAAQSAKISTPDFMVSKEYNCKNCGMVFIQRTQTAQHSVREIVHLSSKGKTQRLLKLKSPYVLCAEKNLKEDLIRNVVRINAIKNTPTQNM